MKRGEVYLVDLSFARFGHEEKGVRPAIIVSNDVFNQNASWGTLVVVPVSTSSTQAQRNYGVSLAEGVGGLTRDSVALCHQITTIDRKRLRKSLGVLPRKDMDRVDAEVSTILYL